MGRIWIGRKAEQPLRHPEWLDVLSSLAPVTGSWSPRAGVSGCALCLALLRWCRAKDKGVEHTNAAIQMLLLLSVLPRGQVLARLPPTAAQMGSRDCVAGSVAIWAAAQDQMKEPFSLFCFLWAWDSQVSVLTVPKSPWPLPSPHWTGLQGRWKAVSVASVTSSAECHKYKGFWQSCLLANYII